MPDDLSQLMTDMGIAPKPLTPEEPLPATDPQGAVGEGTPAVPEPEKDPTPDVVPPVPAEPGSSKAGEAFAALRTQNTKYANFFKKLSERSGADEDTIMNTLLTQITNAEAAELSTSPEVLQRLNDQDERLRKYEEAERTKDIIVALDNLQRDLSLTGDEVKKFVEITTEKGIDLFDSKIDMKTLYRAFNYDSLVKKEVEKERQTIIKTQEKSTSATVPSKTSGQKDDKDPTVINNMSDLNSLFNSAKK